MQRQITVTTPKNNQSQITIDEAVLLGRGVYGQVYIGAVLETQQQLAVKMMDITNTEDRESVKNEVEIMTQLTGSHAKNLVQLHGYFDDSNSMTIAMTYASNGSLKSWLGGKKHPHLTPLQQLKVMHGTASGLAYMHQLNVIHCDLKPANILLDDNVEPMVCDFGLSQVEGTPGLGGSPIFFSPEIMLAIADGDDIFQTKSSDMYAFALICWCIVTQNKYPYNHIQNTTDLYQWVVHKDLREPIPSAPKCSKRIAEFIESEWDANPAVRPSASAAMTILNEEINCLMAAFSAPVASGDDQQGQQIVAPSVAAASTPDHPSVTSSNINAMPVVFKKSQDANCFATLFSTSHAESFKVNQHRKQVDPSLQLTM